MKFNSSIITVLLAAALLFTGASAHAQKSKGQGMGRGEGVGRGQSTSQSTASQGSEAITTTTANVNVSLATKAGRIVVHGWERNEVRARTNDADVKIKLHKAGGGDAAGAAMRIEVLFAENVEEEETQYESCGEDRDVTLDVPRGATVYVETQEGDIEVQDVAEAHIETVDGRIEARRITRSTDASSVGGDVALEDVSGRARLSTMNGVIEARDVRPVDGSDFLKINTVSGDILLNQIGPARVEASTISGEMRMAGPLARGGVYDFTTTSGDVTLLMPVESSFKLNAKVSESGEIVTEFPLKYRGATSPVSLLQAGRLVGAYGSGDATINLISYSGTLRLQKQ